MEDEIDLPGESTRWPEEKRWQHQVLKRYVEKDKDLTPAAGAITHGPLTEQPFDCPVRTVSNILAEYGHEGQTVQLLKVDVEGDELDVLLGIESQDWARIQRVFVEVTNVDGRLDKVVQLLQDHRFIVTVREQQSSEFMGYLMIIPKELALFHVLATKPKQAI